ncbi:MAG TPA: SigE family RNA polymerase sigma factor [Nocardioidaceae bacterium]|nr:SigE family RNA polymerase sigma factor [Nocardioidaceae bacterium]
MSQPADFDAFVASRSAVLLKTAWWLTGDWQHAEDLLQTALAKSLLAWERIEPGREEAYVRRVLVTTQATWWRRAWHHERPAGDVGELVDGPVSGGEPQTATVELRRSLVEALATLTSRQRATVVLRYYCDLSEAETAATMGCSVGTVKSQAAKALARLRALQDTALADLIDEGSR